MPGGAPATSASCIVSMMGWLALPDEIRLRHRGVRGPADPLRRGGHFGPQHAARSPRGAQACPLLSSRLTRPTREREERSGGREAGNTHCTMCSWAAGEERRGKEEG